MASYFYFATLALRAVGKANVQNPLDFVFASPKKSNQKKGDPAFPYFLCSVEFASRKFSELATALLKQTKISYKFNSTKAEKKGTLFVLSSYLSAVGFDQVFISQKKQPQRG